MCPTNQNHVVARRPPLESIKVGSSASPGQQVTETRGGVLKLSKVGLGTLEATERQLQHPGAADHGAGGRHHHIVFCQQCHWGRSSSSTSLQREEGERDGQTAPRRKNPAGVLVFLKTCVLCASFDPTFPFWGQKIYSLLSYGMFTITVQTTTWSGR